MILWRLEINHTLALQSLLPVIKVAFCTHRSLSGIGVPHGVLGDIWVHLELKRGDKGDHWTSSAWERPHRSDTVKSL
ncbi:hypothetical protein F2Q70_00002200 [Brassica cretica]|uniref:Uncharacterized protein n=1 Tax=Brassica cretica TaxID=69181 RepID=A0A8S9J616_BRACR|nr:hypothetical protein F2Q70_00002200 [Brassica cretica]